MYLKEAFRYQNFISELFNQTIIYLSDSHNVVKTTQEHMRKKVNPEAEDETIDTSSERELSYSANDLVRFMEHLIAERMRLATAISRTKTASHIDLDAEIANNKMRQRAAATLALMGNIRPKERITKASGYKFNAEGNQTTYTYDIKEVSIIDFDRKMVKGVARKLNAEADKISEEIDQAMVNLVVEYEPLYDINDSLEDVIEQFLDSK